MISYISIFFVFVSYRMLFGSFGRITLLHVFALSHSMLIVVGLPLIEVPSHQYTLYFWSAISIPFLVLLGAIFHHFFALNKKINSRAYYKIEEVLVRGSWPIFFMFLAFLLLYIVDIGLDKSALLHSIANPGSAVGSMELRLDGLDSNISPLMDRIYGYARSIFTLFFCSFFTVVFCEGRISRLLYFLIISFSLFYCFYTAAKAPAFYLILAVGLSYYWHKRSVIMDGRRAFRIAIVFISVVIFGLVLSSALFPILHGYSGTDAVAYAAEKLVERLFIIPTEAAFYHFEVFGSIYERPGLKSIGISAWIMGEETVNVAALLYSHYYDNQFAGRGLLNAAFFSSVYASFGFIAMAVSSFFVGFILSLIESFLRSISSEAIRLSTKAVCVLAVAQLPMADLTSTLSGRGLVLMPLIVFLLGIVFSSFSKNKVQL